MARYMMISLEDLEISSPASFPLFFVLTPPVWTPLGSFIMRAVVTGSVARSGIYWNRRIQRRPINPKAHKRLQCAYSLHLFLVF